MRLIAMTAVIAALAAPLPASAQDRTEEDAARVADTLSNPAVQEGIADGVAAASEALLDVPLAPLARAVAQASGEDPRDIDPNLTLRDVSPETQDLPAEIHRTLPRAMGAMAGMAGGVSEMIPALREAARRMKDAVERAGAY